MVYVTLHEVLKLWGHSISLLHGILMCLSEELPVFKLGRESLSDFCHQVILLLDVLVEGVRIVLITRFVDFNHASDFRVDNLILISLQPVDQLFNSFTAS